jgi:hypothetical protein
MPPVQVPGRLDASIWANWLTLPPGDICTIVVPVPCSLETALKLLMSKFPLTNFPTVFGTTKIPYGFTSPFEGTVEAMTEMVWAEADAGDSAVAPHGASHERASTVVATRAGIRA